MFVPGHSRRQRGATGSLGSSMNLALRPPRAPSLRAQATHLQGLQTPGPKQHRRKNDQSNKASNSVNAFRALSVLILKVVPATLDLRACLKPFNANS